MAQSHLVLLDGRLVPQNSGLCQALRKFSFHSAYFLTQLFILQVHLSYLLILVHHRHLQELIGFLEVLFLERALIGYMN